MIGHTDAKKLRSLDAPQVVVPSLCLPVPLDPAALRGLSVRGGELMVGARAAGPDATSAVGASHADRGPVTRKAPPKLSHPVPGGAALR
jgi:hypothetical protein